MTCEILQIILQFSLRVFSSQTYATHTHTHTLTPTCIDVRQVHTYYLCWHFLLLVLVSFSPCTCFPFLFVLLLLFYFSVASHAVACVYKTLKQQQQAGERAGGRRRRRRRQSRQHWRRNFCLCHCQVALKVFSTHTHTRRDTQTHTHWHTLYKGLVPSGLALSLSHSLWLLLWHKILFALLNFYFQFNFLAWRFDPAANLMPSLIRPLRLPRLQFRQ